MTKVSERLVKSVEIVLQLAESKWINRIWSGHKLTNWQEDAIRQVSQWIDHRLPFDRKMYWIPTQNNTFIIIEEDLIVICDNCSKVQADINQ